jgi:hypothetical protein
MLKDKKPSSEKAARIRAEGEEGGYAEAAFDAEKRLWYRLDTLKERQYFECPPDHVFDAEGVIHPKKTPPEKPAE